MNHLLKISILLAGIVVPVIVCHGQSQASGTDTPIKMKLNRKSTPTKHRTPSNMFLEYEYVQNGIFLYPSHLYEYVELYVESISSTDCWSAILSEENGLFIETGILQGQYSITAITENEVTYHGVLIVG